MSDSENSEKGFKRFAAKHVIVGILIAVVGMWVLGTILGFFGDSHQSSIATQTHSEKNDITIHPPEVKKDTGHADKDIHDQTPVETSHLPDAVKKDIEPSGHSQVKGHALQPVKKGVPGTAFVDAAIKPLEYELEERFWGWRPNDILNFTDNVNNYQLGVLEVTRRTSEKLTEDISRTGSTASFDKNLENARSSCFMVQAKEYWFPSPEGKYRDGIKELRKYAEKLEKRESSFYSRADNLIPLLKEYEHLLGSCDDNLVKTKEKDGSDVSFFIADDYFYYAKGVAHAMGTILEAVMVDFNTILETRHGVETLHHAIESCHHATAIDPWIITDSSLSSIFANHRANMAAHISHARFYIGVLIKTLST